MSHARLRFSFIAAVCASFAAPLFFAEQLQGQESTRSEATPLLLVTDQAESPAVQSAATLFGTRLRVKDCSVESTSEVPADTRNVLVLLHNPANLAKVNVKAIAGAAENGRTVIMGLDEYGHWTGARVTETRMTNVAHLAGQLEDEKSIAAYGNAWREYLSGKGIAPAMLALRDKLKAEVTEPVPSLEVVADDPALRGFPIGSVVPWCSAGTEFSQQQLDADSLPAGARVLARSTVNGRPMMVRHDIGQGRIYAMALRHLPEPQRRNWETRGGFNKWIPISNVFAKGVLAGTCWNGKPTYAEYCKRLREVATNCPSWIVEHIGRYRLGDQELEKIYSFRIGAPEKPVWVILGMVHAEDEWVPALGALDFIRYVEQHRHEPPLAQFFSKYSLRVVPLLHPAIFESPRYEPGQRRPTDELTLAVTAHDDVYGAMQLHEGGESIVTACGTPRAMGLALGKTARKISADRFVLWRDMAWKGKPGVLRPMQPEDWVLGGSVIGGPVPEWDVYWVQGNGSCHGSYRLDQMMQAKALHFLEQPMMGFMPDALSGAPSHYWIHRSVFEAPGYMTLWENDQTVAYCLAFLLTPIAKGMERPVDWKPFSKDRKAAAATDNSTNAWTREELSAFMKQLTRYVVDHHIRRDNSPMRGKVYEFHDPKTGRQGYGAGWDTMHDGGWFANACILAYRATGDEEFLKPVRDWVLPFYLRMLNHSDELFPNREKAFSDGEPLPVERSEATKGFVPYWWDDGHGVNFDAVAMRLTIPQLLGNRFGYTFTLADTNARDGRLAGYSHGTSHHLALALFPMLANAWLLTRDPAVAEAIQNLHSNRLHQRNMDLPFLAIADFASHGEDERAFNRAAGYAQLPATPDTPRYAAFVAKRKNQLPPFIDDPAAKYYALMMARRVDRSTAKWLARLTYDCVVLEDEWYGSRRRPRGLAVSADSLHKVWIVDGKFESLAGDVPEVLVGSRMGPQSLWACALSLQLLRAFTDAWGVPATYARSSSETHAPKYTEPPLSELEARLREELDAGLRFWQHQMNTVGFIRADWPIGGEKPSKTYWRDQMSESGGYAHLISACAEYLVLLDGQRDWELAWTIRAR